MTQIMDDWRTTKVRASTQEPSVKALTADDLADAFGCFWNAAIGDAHNRQDSTAFAVIGSMAEGFAAIERRLREHAALVPAASKAT